MARALRTALALRALRAVFALVVLALLAAASASAEPGFEYEEVLPSSGVRIGGFDSSAYDHGRFDGPLTPGKFVDPTGFAVDPIDNTVYVVDRTSSSKANSTDWRIQQFSPTTGEVLGTTMFTLPNEPSKGPGRPPNASAIEGLAVDHSAKRLYALVVGSPPSSSPYPSFTVVQELLAWSTKPVAGGLVAATAVGGGQLPPDPLASEVPGSPGTVGGVVSREGQLLSGETLLYGPQGIAVDPLEVPGVDNPVAIEASDIRPGAGRGHPVPADTIVQQVATQGAATGELLTRWSGVSVEGTLGYSWGPHGISTGPDGTLTVLLEAEGAATDVYAVKLKADFSDATVLDSPANVSPSGAPDQSPMFINESPFYSVAGTTVSDLKGAGPQVVHLSAMALGSADGLYAAVIFSDVSTDSQVGPTAPPGPQYWTSGENASEEFEANIGVRLLEPGADAEAISNLQGRTIVNTLGNAARGKQCNIGAPEAVLAAGAGGTLWILDRGPKADQREARGQGREVIELAPGLPGSERLCPKPSGTFTMTTPAGQGVIGVNEAGEETLTIPAGTQVTFDAKSVHRQGGKPFAYEWDLDGNPTNGPNSDGFEKVYEMVPEKYYYPPSSVTYMYARPGEYKVRLRMRTDYGVYTPPLPSTVIVTKAPFHPEPRFTATPSGGQQVTFNASGSTPGVGKIVNYHWSWGDGGEEDEDPQTPVAIHTYTPGSYRVTLTVTNSAYQSVTSAPQTVTVVAPAPPKAAISLTAPLYDIPPAFALYPIPPTGADRAPTRLSPRARFAGGALSVTLACPAAKRLCAGTISVETAAALAATARTGRTRHRAKASRLLLGRAAFSIPGGQRRTVKVRLSARGMALLKSRKRLKVLVVVSAHDSFGDPGTATLALTLNASAARAHRSSGRATHGRR